MRYLGIEHGDWLNFVATLQPGETRRCEDLILYDCYVWTPEWQAKSADERGYSDGVLARIRRGVGEQTDA